jgi:hypothetical protein
VFDGQRPDVATYWAVDPDVLTVFGHGETEAVPAGLVERGPEGMGLFDDLPHAARAAFTDVVYAVVVDKTHLRHRSMLSTSTTSTSAATSLRSVHGSSLSLIGQIGYSSS